MSRDPKLTFELCILDINRASYENKDVCIELECSFYVYQSVVKVEFDELPYCYDLYFRTDFNFDYFVLGPFCERHHPFQFEFTERSAYLFLHISVTWS